MSKNHVFFSYSRDNSEFVLELAKKLRKAGAKVWLDQLDIKTGERWDRSIEKALEASDVFMIILSKSSVKSNNVMDEVSFALEEGKKVLPVLLEECDVPFRLRRLQFADFSTNPEEGMKVLVSALELDSAQVDAVDASSKLAHTVHDTQKQSEIKQAAAVEEQEPMAVSAGATKSSGSKKPLIYGIIAVVAAFAIWGIYSATSGGGMSMMEMCKADWAELEEADRSGEETNQLAALRRHIELYAPCPHENDAMDRISFLKAMGNDSMSLETEIETEQGNDSIYTSTTTDAITDTPVTESTSNEPPAEQNRSDNNTNTSDIENPVDTTNEVEPTTPPVEIVEEVAIIEPLTGKDVHRVDFNGGYFMHISGKDWIEMNNGNERKFTMLKRDKKAVYLADGPDVRLTLDISKYIIYYADANTPEREQYVITSTEGKPE